MTNPFRHWRRPLRLGIAGALLAAGAAASAQVAFTTQAANMRAGPDRAYPLVAWIAPNTPLQVFGCVNGWQWCDVQWGPNRGWIYAGFLSYTWNNQPTVILQGGPALGLPLVTWSIGPYWDSYYRNRPWWGNRTYWYNRPPPSYPAWRPPPPRPPHYAPPPHRPPNYVPPPNRPPQIQPIQPRPPRPVDPGYRPPPGGGSPGTRPPGQGRPPDAGRPPSQGGGGGGRPPGGGNRPPPSRPVDTTNPQQ